VAAPLRAPPITPAGVRRTAPGVPSAGEPCSPSFHHRAVMAGTLRGQRHGEVACAACLASQEHTLDNGTWCMECCLHIYADGTVRAVDTGVTLPKYNGEPRRRREEHARGMLGLLSWHKRNVVSLEICDTLTPGNSTVACHRLQGDFVSLMYATLYARVSMHDEHTAAMQIDAVHEFATQRHWTVADTVAEVATSATDHRPKRQVHLKISVKRRWRGPWACGGHPCSACWCRRRGRERRKCGKPVQVCAQSLRHVRSIR